MVKWVFVIGTMVFGLQIQASQSLEIFQELSDRVQPCDLKAMSLISIDENGQIQNNEAPFPSYQARQLIRMLNEIQSRRGLQLNQSMWNEIQSHLPSYLCQMRVDGLVGSCMSTFSVQNRSSRGAWYEREIVNLNPEARSRVISLFENSSQVDRIDQLQPPATDYERQLIVEQGVLPGAVAELRAMREASSVFERSTYMHRDRGGWLGNNMLSIVNPSTIMTCGAEALTHRTFYNSLVSAGHIQRVSVVGQRVRAVGTPAAHAANTFSLPTSDGGRVEIVLDSWKTEGGEPPLFCTTEEWDGRRSCPRGRIRDL